MAGRTTLVIGSRAGPLASKVDKVVVLDEGRIVEEGAHVDVLLQHGLYHRLDTDADVAALIPRASV